MSDELKVGLTQWHATEDVAANLSHAIDVVQQCSLEGAEVVLLPENGLMLSTSPRMRERAFTLTSPEIQRLRETAAQSGVVVILGGMKHQLEDRVTNSAIVIGSDGEIAGRYDKIHLFDARVSGQSFEASSVETPGAQPVILDVADWKLGLTICYDVRFPELYRNLALSGAEVLLVPSAFTQVTGAAHWESLLRARAIENGCYVVASATVTPPGVDSDAFTTFGHAVVIDPWGRVLADLGTQAVAATVMTLQRDEVQRARESLPVLQQTRPDAYATAPVTFALDEIGS